MTNITNLIEQYKSKRLLLIMDNTMDKSTKDYQLTQLDSTLYYLKELRDIYNGKNVACDINFTF